MCVSASVSFSLGAFLITGGAVAAYRAMQTDKRYLALAIFPALVGMQQMAEGFVWLAAENGHEPFIRIAALVYLFFTWMMWPSWVPYMTARLEPNPSMKKVLNGMALGGLFFGTLLYLPNYWMPDWLNISIVYHSIAYQCSFLLHDYIPLAIPYIVYLTLIGLPPLLSSHTDLKIFGIILITFVFITYYFFAYAHVSVLCFFAAAMTIYILRLILADKCAEHDAWRTTASQIF